MFPLLFKKQVFVVVVAFVLDPHSTTVQTPAYLQHFA